MGSITGKMQALILLVVVLFAPEAGADEDQAQVYALSISPSSSSDAMLKGCDWGPGALVPEEIIGGMESKPHSRPYMAHLEITTDSGSAANCGGFLISQKFVMTAAHCEGRKITVTLGVHNLTQEESTWQRRKVAEQIVHPNYNSFTNLNDIMLLKLQRRAKLTHAVATVPLPTRSAFIQPGRVCRTAGWGKTGVMKPGSDVLREVKLRIMNGKACDHFQLYDHNLQICVGNPKKKRSAFKGDSGGPLLCAGVAHGIVSYGRGNAKPPAIFTRVSPYVPWIKKILKGN